MKELMSYPHIGNVELLERQKVAFLAPGQIRSLSVLPTLQWAAQMAGREEVTLVSGWSSRLEQEVLQQLLAGKCGIVLVLGRALYKKLPALWQPLLDSRRLLILSVSQQQRLSRQAAFRRNEIVCRMADEVVFPCIPPQESSLRSLYEACCKHHSVTLLMDSL